MRRISFLLLFLPFFSAPASAQGHHHKKRAKKEVVTSSPVMQRNFQQPVDSSFHLVIYNRWGEKVNEAYGKDAGWDGRDSHAGSSGGTYFYVFSCPDKTYKGTISVIR